MDSLTYSINVSAVQTLCNLGMQFKPERLHHLEHGRKIRYAFTGERFIKALPAQAGAFRHLGHALRGQCRPRLWQ